MLRDTSPRSRGSRAFDLSPAAADLSEESARLSGSLAAGELSCLKASVCADTCRGLVKSRVAGVWASPRQVIITATTTGIARRVSTSAFYVCEFFLQKPESSH